MEQTFPMHSCQSGGEKGPSLPQDQQITALPVRSFRDSNVSVVLASQTKTYGRVVSHIPHASASANISHDPFSHRRRGSTLKIVMRRIFGKKRQSTLEEDDVSEEPAVLKKAHPGPARAAFLGAKSPSNSGNMRSASIRKKSLALSHSSSLSSDNVALTPQDNRIEIPNQVLRRRATLPSLILTEDDDDEIRKSIYSAVSPISTRPATAVSESNVGQEDSTSQTACLKAHRRSRSADALQELVRRHRMSPIQWRRRSGEMEPWVTSGSDEDQHEDDAQQPQADISDAPVTSPTPEKIEVDRPQSEPESAQFQFESLLANMADPDATVEQRLTTIEVKLMDLEFAIAKIQGTDTDVFSKPAENLAKRRQQPSEGLSSVASESSSQSSLSFADGDGDNGRPISTVTVRPNVIYEQQPMPWQGNTWSSSMNLHGISIEQYSALVTLVRREQTARKALESTVAQLQEEMQQLRRASGLPESPPGTLYPLPSPDSEDTKFSHRHRRPHSSRKDSNTSADTKISSDTRSRDSFNRYRSIRDSESRTTPNMI